MKRSARLDIEVYRGRDRDGQTQEHWKARAREFLQKQAPARGARLPNLYRKAAYYFLTAVDHMLLSSIGLGLAAFRSAAASSAASSSGAPAAASPACGLTLALCIDQGSDGWAAIQWLLYMASLRMVVFHDPSHRNWNDLRNAIGAAGLWDAVLLWGVVFSCNHGPFESASWWRAAQHAAADYSQHASATCPLLQSMLHRIAAESGCPDRVFDPDYPAEVVRDLCTDRAFSLKGPALALSRWMSWMHCWSFWEKHIAKRGSGAPVPWDQHWLHDPRPNPLHAHPAAHGSAC